MSGMVVRYRVRRECAELNERLIAEVFEELHAVAPAGLTYQSLVLEDGVSFVHVVDGDSSVLNDLAAFQRFAWTVGERCEDPPQASTARRVGLYDGSER
jgi:hypothetical protein